MTFFEHSQTLYKKEPALSSVMEVCDMRKRIVVFLEDTPPTIKKTSGLGLRLIIRKNIER